MEANKEYHQWIPIVIKEDNYPMTAERILNLSYVLDHHGFGNIKIPAVGMVNQSFEMDTRYTDKELSTLELSHAQS